MEPRIETLIEKKLVGMHTTMSLVENKTQQLWQSFMSKRSEIKHAMGSDLISLQEFSSTHYFKDFNPHNTFEKWACLEVSIFENIPEGMQSYLLPGGMYAVFDYVGSSANPAIFNHIFGTWLPNSHYELDNRPHFEVLGAGFKVNDETSEEEIWIPIK